MIKVKVKVSGSFRSPETGQDFCLVRSYLYTCRAHGILPHDALMLLYSGKLPDFIDLNADLPQLKIITPEERKAQKDAEKAAKKAAKKAEREAKKAAKKAEKEARKFSFKKPTVA